MQNYCGVKMLCELWVLSEISGIFEYLAIEVKYCLLYVLAPPV